MRALELKVPPPVVALAVALVMWAMADHGPLIPMSRQASLVAAVINAAVGIALDVCGLIGFRRGGTTINPMRPQATSALVRTGVYALTRNPMYLGMLFMLIAWALYLSSGWGLLGPFLFVLYMNRFQIMPEERMLARKFGDEYESYCRRVRRWI